jgi:putative flavoprotein involved in K+ transport
MLMSVKTRTAEVAVIGAGPGGLGAAALLKRRGVDVVILERGQSIAPKWRAGYDRLRINTSSWFSYLPGRRFPRKAGRWVSRDDLVAYYDDYAARHELRVQTGVEAKRIEPADGGWRVETSSDPVMARAVVVGGKCSDCRTTCSGFSRAVRHAAWLTPTRSSCGV